ncbi:MAG: hypothetical protein ACI4PM_05205 [Butyricicoccus sp.]
MANKKKQRQKHRQAGRIAAALPDYHKYDRWFTAVKVLLTVAPLIALGYLRGMTGGGSLSELLQNNPEITVTFLTSMAGPFIAYLLGFAQKHMYEGDTAYMVSHLLFMLVAEAMLRNMVYGILMIALLYMVFRMSGTTPLAAIRTKWHDGHFWRDLSGCIVLLVFSAFCMFVSFRLGMW